MNGLLLSDMSEEEVVKKSRGLVLRRSTSFLERKQEANCSMTLTLAMMTLEKNAIVLA